MPSLDARILLPIAVPTAAAGAVTAVVGAVIDGGTGALGGVIGAAVVIVFMGAGILGLQYTAKHWPSLFQAMGLALYTFLLLVLFVFVAVFKDTTAFNPKVFAAAIIVCTVAWVVSMAFAHKKAKIFYIDPDSSESEKSEKTGSSS
ncbi:hypothetical protein H9Y04_02025 [Streptomyces sp. TRM66268-LWL]|uniref:ATP synthase I n=1 Tax=Streptomyces polyasparticus TaxID=2767826 RepID=A0ABR7S8U3_9ACTN|nr:hypothetical protein [Streptomyces polyasparticus]MBC9711347.1 hypothetical protein [Streptomyces polyasparticus]